MNINQGAIIRGVVKVHTLKAGTAEKSWQVADFLRDVERKARLSTNQREVEKHERIAQELRKKLRNIFENGYIATPVECHNLITASSDRGMGTIIKQLAGSSAYTLEITHGEIGTSATTPTEADTALNAGVSRKEVTVVTELSNKSVQFQFFWSDLELTNDTYREFGIYANGTTLTLGNGRMFNHALFSPVYNKSSSEDTTVEVQITL